jgi:hypothetical protein
MLGLFFDPEYGGDFFLRNVGWLSTDYTALYPRRWYSTWCTGRTEHLGRDRFPRSPACSGRGSARDCGTERPQTSRSNHWQLLGKIKTQLEWTRTQRCEQTELVAGCPHFAVATSQSCDPSWLERVARYSAFRITVNPRYNEPRYNGQNLTVYNCEFL